MNAATKPLPAELRAPITDARSAQSWLQALVANDLAFHLEDDPEEIGYITWGTDDAGNRVASCHTRTFRTTDVPLLRERVAQLYALPPETWAQDGCPIGYILRLESEREC